MKRLLLFLVGAAAGAFWYVEHSGDLAPAGIEQAAPERQERASDIEALFGQQRSNVQVRGEGTVLRTLPDDNEGSRHQRFILELPSGRTLLISHNIDLAPRISSLDRGDRVEFYGEYEWNDKGGVVHWTHDDPQGKHVAGWLKHRGKTYQ